MLSNKNVKIWLTVFGTAIGFYLLNIFQGSIVDLNLNECNYLSTSMGIGIVTLIAFLIIIFFNLALSDRIKIILLAILISSVSTEIIEPYIFDFQMNITERNLKLISGAIEDYKSSAHQLPEHLEGLISLKNQKTGFKIFDNKIEYIKIDELNYKLIYEVKHGFKCEAINGSTFLAGLKYTCIRCSN